MARKPKSAKGGTSPPRGLPSKDEILEFLKSSTEKVGKREIARAFGIRGDARQDLKSLLAEMSKDGKLAGIISIGDVVKRRIAEVEREAAEIREYITMS